jgi:hypothetical protein
MICRVAELIDKPTGSPEWEIVSGLPSGSDIERFNGVIATPTVLD